MRRRSHLRDGDTLLVTRIDRLARSVRDLMNIVHELGERGVRVKATEQSFDTGDIYGEMTMNLLAVFADFETKLRKERQMEGIERAKKRGVYQGRKPTIDADQVKTLKEQGMGATAIAKEARRAGQAAEGATRPPPKVFDTRLAAMKHRSR